MANQTEPKGEGSLALVLYDKSQQAKNDSEKGLDNESDAEDSKKTILESIEKTTKRIKALQDKIGDFDDLKSHLFIIKKRFNQQSTLDRLSLYYWDSVWYNKLLMGAMKAGVIGLGFALQLTGAAILLLGLTALIFGVLVEHGKNYRAREKSLCDDVSLMEENLKLEVKELQALDVELSECLIKHNEEILKLCDSNILLNQTVRDLNESKKSFEKTIKTLQDARDKLKKSLKTFEKQCKTLNEELSETKKSMLEKIDENTELSKEIKALSARVELSKSSLSEVHLAYVERVARLTKVANELEVGVGEFNKQAQILKNETKKQSKTPSFFKPQKQALGDSGSELSYDEVVALAEKTLRARGYYEKEEIQSPASNPCPWVH